MLPGDIRWHRRPSRSNDELVLIFRCARCRTALTAPLREVPLPHPDEAPIPYRMQGDEDCPPRMAPGTYAVEPAPGGGRPGGRTPASAPDALVLCPADVRNVRPIHGKGRRSGCCGPDGQDGPNLACTDCGAEVATESADCWTVQQVALVPAAVEAPQSA